MSQLSFDNSWAVVIGINRYTHGIAPLRTAVADAQAVAQLLETEHGYKVFSLLNENAQLATLKTLLTKTLPSKLTGKSRLLLYFAGHGIAQDGDDGPAGYLIPQNAIPGNVDTYLPMVTLHDTLTALPCRHFLAVFDCCFAGAFRWSSTRDISFSPDVIHQERFDRFQQDPAWQVITSASYDQTAVDVLSLRDDRGETAQQHSPFAQALLEALQGDADTSPPARAGRPAGDGVITATELYIYLRDSVEVLTQEKRKRQTPEICSLRNHDKGEYIFLSPGHELNLPPAPPLNIENNPYRGLESFNQADHNLFFGREKEIEQLLARLETPHPLTVVLGASGTGKSSLVKAGLLPLLTDRTEFQVLPVMRPGNRPIKSLARTCAELTSTDEASKLIRRFSEDENALVETVGKWRQVHPHRKLLLVIDQAEELITQAISPRESYQFQRLVKRVMAEHWACLWIVATLRLDFEAQFQDEALQAEWMDARFVIPPMGQTQLREAIEKPAAARVLYFEPHSLVDKLVEDVAQTPGALPLMSFTLSELYLRYLKRRSDNRALTETDYRELGGVAGALTRRATHEYETLVAQDSAYEKTVKDVMLRMIAVAGGELARRRVPLSELVYSDDEENARVQQLLDNLIAARLLVRGQDEQSEPYVEPAHDALVRGWDKLLRWKREEQEGLALQRILAPTAKGWERQTDPKKARGLLWDNNPRLSLLKEILKSERSWLNKTESAFVESSLKLKRKKRVRLVGALIGVIASLSGLSLGLSALNYRLADANEEAFAKQLVATAETMTDKNSINRTTGALLAVYAHQLLAEVSGDEVNVNQVLRRSLTIPKRQALIHPDDVNAVSFSPDGQRLATASGDGMARIWDMRTQQMLFEFIHDEPVIAVDFHPEDQLLATASLDGTVRLWNTATGKQVRSLELEGEGLDVSFSPDGRSLATGSAEGSAVIWDVSTGEARMRFEHEDDVNAVSFSPDGKRLATASYDYTAVVWDLRSQEAEAEFEHESFVTDVSFAPDSKQVATASSDGTVQVWEIDREKEPLVLPHEDWVSGVAFSPDGRNLVTVSDDYFARVWDARQGRPVGELQHDDPVLGVAFSPDGRQVATGSVSAIASVWNLAEALELRRAAHNDSVTEVMFSPDGQQVATASADSSVRLWDSNTGLTQFTFSHPASITTIRYSPDGQQIATGSRDNITRLWDTGTGNKRFELRHNGPVTGIAFNPDGQTIATTSRDKTLRIWETETGQQRWEGQHEGAVTGISFSPDGEQMLSISDGLDVIVWESETGEELFELPTQEKVALAQFSPDTDAPLIAIVEGNQLISLWNWETQHRFTFDHTFANVFGFSDDGRYFATAGRQGNMKVWDILDLEIIADEQPGVPAGDGTEWQVYSLEDPLVTFSHEGAVNAISFSADGRFMATASTDRSARLWDVDGAREGIIQTPIAGAVHEGPVNTVSVSPLGDRLATGSADNTISIGWVNSEDLAKQVCQRLGRNLHPEDWNRYMTDGREYEAICPNLPLHPAASWETP